MCGRLRDAGLNRSSTLSRRPRPRTGRFARAPLVTPYVFGYGLRIQNFGARGMGESEGLCAPYARTWVEQGAQARRPASELVI